MYGVCHAWYYWYRDVNKKENDIDVKREGGVEINRVVLGIITQKFI